MTDSWGERHQSALYLTSMAVGVVLSLFCPPEVSEVSDALVPYALAVLLFANFMSSFRSGPGTGTKRGTRCRIARIYPMADNAQLYCGTPAGHDFASHILRGYFRDRPGGSPRGAGTVH